MLSTFMEEGGFTMIPLLLAGAGLVALSVLFAARPSQQLKSTTFALALVVLLGGALGFVMGLRTTVRNTNQIDDLQDRARVLLVGSAESSNNVVLALLFVLVAAVAVTVGTFRERRAN